MLVAPFGYYYNLLLSNCFTSSSLVQLHDVIIKKDLLSTLHLRRLKTFSMYFSRLLIASSGQRLIASYVPLSKQTSKLCVDNLDLISETSDKISHCYKFKIYMNFGILQVKYFLVRLFFWPFAGMILTLNTIFCTFLCSAIFEANLTASSQ